MTRTTRNSSKKFEVPPDYTFAPDTTLIHKDAYERLEKLLNEARDRDPDIHRMYIYNDFFGYATLDLVDHTLSSIHTFVVKKKYLNAWRLLDCLCKFTNEYADWQNVDDGERVVATVKAFGAMLMTTLRGLDQSTPSLLNEETLPELETSLETAARVFNEGNDWEEPYNKVIRAYGRKLFGKRTQEERKKIWETRYDAFFDFLCNLSEEDKKKRNVEVVKKDETEQERATPGKAEEKVDEDENDEDKEPWYGDADIKDVDTNPRCFRVSPTWKEYKDFLAESPQAPFRGPPTWNLTEWTEAEKRPFSFDNPSAFE